MVCVRSSKGNLTLLLAAPSSLCMLQSLPLFRSVVVPCSLIDNVNAERKRGHSARDHDASG